MSCTHRYTRTMHNHSKNALYNHKNTHKQGIYITHINKHAIPSYTQYLSLSHTRHTHINTITNTHKIKINDITHMHIHYIHIIIHSHMHTVSTRHGGGGSVHRGRIKRVNSEAGAKQDADLQEHPCRKWQTLIQFRTLY